MDDYSQVAFVTRDLPKAIREWHAIGAGPFYPVDLSAFDAGLITDRSYRGGPAADTFAAAIGFLGTTQIELVQPTNTAPSVFREVLDRRGEGLHHMQGKVSVVVPEMFDELADRYAGQGLELAAHINTPWGTRTAFYDAMATHGCFFEIAEKGPQTFAAVMAMHRAHLRRGDLPMILEWPEPGS